MERPWNTLVNESCENPFLLSEFTKQFIESNRFKDWTPLVLVISANHRIIGIAPLITKKRFGVRSVKFFHPSWLSSDFIFYDQYRETCIASTLDFLFKTLKCKFADFLLPGDSPNLEVLKQQCKTKRINFRKKPGIARRILPIRCTWTKFEMLRGSNFRQRFRKNRAKAE